MYIKVYRYMKMFVYVCKWTRWLVSIFRPFEENLGKGHIDPLLSFRIHVCWFTIALNHCIVITTKQTKRTFFIYFLPWKVILEKNQKVLNKDRQIRVWNYYIDPIIGYDYGNWTPSQDCSLQVKFVPYLSYLLNSPLFTSILTMSLIQL